MATVVQYVAQLRSRQVAIAQKMGVWLPGMPKELRVLWLSQIAMLGVILRLLVAKGIVTDVELTAAFDDAMGGAYDPEAVAPLTVDPAGPPGP